MAQPIQGACNGTGSNNGVREASAFLQAEAHHHIQQWDIERSTANASRISQQCTLRCEESLVGFNL